MTLLEQISSNRRKTVLLFLGFFVLYALIGVALAYLWGTGASLLVIIFAVALIIVALFFGDNVAVAVARGKQITSREQAPELWDAVETTSLAAGIDMPRVFISPDPTANAFAAGRSQQQALVCVNIGLLRLLDKEELEGVVAHEVAHIRNQDVRLMTYVAVLAGSIALLSYFVSRMIIYSNNRNAHPIIILVALLGIILAPIAATIIQLAISRRREFLADASASDLTRYPQGLASALERISAEPVTKGLGSPATAHMYFSPLRLEKKGFGHSLFATHPPSEERIERLLQLSSGVAHEHNPRPLSPQLRGLIGAAQSSAPGPETPEN